MLQSPAELAIIEEAYQAFMANSDEIEGEVKGHYEGEGHVQLYVDTAFATYLYTMRKNAEKGWDSETASGNEVEMQVRDERCLSARNWIQLN